MNSIDNPSDTTILFRIDFITDISVTFCAVPRTKTSFNSVSVASKIISKLVTVVTVMVVTKSLYPM